MGRRNYNEGEFDDIFENEDRFESLEDFLDEIDSFDDYDLDENN